MHKWNLPWKKKLPDKAIWYKSLDPVECDQTCNILPRLPERSGIILLKLKRKLEFGGHLYFQVVRPRVVDDNLFKNI